MLITWDTQEFTEDEKLQGFVARGTCKGSRVEVKTSQVLTTPPRHNVYVNGNLEASLSGELLDILTVEVPILLQEKLSHNVTLTFDEATIVTGALSDYANGHRQMARKKERLRPSVAEDLNRDAKEAEDLSDRIRGIFF